MPAKTLEKQGDKELNRQKNRLFSLFLRPGTPHTTKVSFIHVRA
jgi:hypothetical protein